MNAHVLISEAEKFEGLYVAMASFSDRRVISSGNDPARVYQEAKDVGAADPVIVFVPEKDMVNIY